MVVRVQDTYRHHGAGLDAFERRRVSEPLTIFDSKQVFDNQPDFWDEALETGDGIASAHSTDTASTVLTSTDGVAGLFTRQTFMRFNYQPGKSHLINMTVVLGLNAVGGVGVKRRCGYFDDENGLFYENDQGVFKIGRRTKTSGSVVTTMFGPGEAEGFSVDPMDGNGVSGINLNLLNIQEVTLDFGWLSADRVRMNLRRDGLTYPIHEILTADRDPSSFMSTPNLPLRYQMETTSSSPASTMSCNCSSIASEGGMSRLGSLRSVGNDGTHVDANVENTLYAILGLRLKSDHFGISALMEKLDLAEYVGEKDLQWQLLFNPTVAGTFTYVGVDDSGIEVAKGATANTVTGGTVVDGGRFSSAKKGGADARELENARRLGASIGDVPDELVLAVRPVGGSTNADVEADITYRELQ